MKKYFFIILFVTASCSPVSRTDLIGEYSIKNTNYIVNLKINDDANYRFCYKFSCQNGIYKVRYKPSDGGMRVEFSGHLIEQFSRDIFVLKEYDPEPNGQVEFDVERSLNGPMINIEPMANLYLQKI